MSDIFLFALRNIFRKMNRTLLTMTGIIIGVTSVVVISCISTCGTTAVNEELDSLGLSGINVSVKNDKSLPLTNTELELVEDLEFVESATPVMAYNSTFTSNDLETQVITWGIDENAQETVSLKVLYGQFFNKNDIAAASKICLVDKAFSSGMFNSDNIVGRNIKININGITETFKVVGVLKTGNGLLQNALSGYVPSFVYIPYTTASEITGMSNYNQIITKVNSSADIDKLSERITDTLNASKGIDEGYQANNMAKQRDALTNILSIVTLVLTAIGAISLFVAGLSIMTVMLVSVSERKREIGIKKSIGASEKTIICEFLTEAFLISAIASLLGAVLGIVISFIGTSAMNMKLIIDWKTILFAIAFSIASGVIFGVYPSIKAARLKPILALKYE